MVLVDTSVWIGHFRVASLPLVQLLKETKVVVHPFVIGELACGHLARRHEVLALLGKLSRLAVVSDTEALAFIDGNRLAGMGIGWVDVHLLASARLACASVMTTDKALARAARRLGLA
jgi:predicted nucleic acid-binding protein